MCISIAPDCGGAAPYKWKKVRQGSRETERECVCMRVLVETKDSVDQHPQTTWEERHMETHLVIKNAAVSLIN
jgi:hypothetical protein